MDKAKISGAGILHFPQRHRERARGQGLKAFARAGALGYAGGREVQGMKRKTSQRAAIEQVFCEQDRPLGIEEILESGRLVVESLNQATVYRNLKLLLENGWLRQVYHPSLGTLYERTGKGHHHHFHCRLCNRVYDLPGCAVNEKEAAPAGFVVEDHECFLFGVCPGCREK